MSQEYLYRNHLQVLAWTVCSLACLVEPRERGTLTSEHCKGSPADCFSQGRELTGITHQSDSLDYL